MKIILFQPQIPQNTGNIARTCACTNTELILVRPLGFSTKSRWLKRAGLDYWNDLTTFEIDDLEMYLSVTTLPFFFFSSKGKQPYTTASFPSDSLLIFGSETAGLPSSFWKKWETHFWTIPMMEKARCLNLATSAAIVLYEALRQNHFPFPKRAVNKQDKTIPINTEEVRGM